MRSDLSSGFSMLGSQMPSLELMQRMRKGLSPEELQAAFARRYGHRGTRACVDKDNATCVGGGS
jgi:hypothetical protein